MSEISKECFTCAKVAICAQADVSNVLSGFVCPLFMPVTEPVVAARSAMVHAYGLVPAARTLLRRPHDNSQEEHPSMRFEKPPEGTTYSERKKQLEIMSFMDVRIIGNKQYKYRDAQGNDVPVLDWDETLQVDRKAESIEKVLQFELQNRFIVPDAAAQQSNPQQPQGAPQMSQQPPFPPNGQTPQMPQAFQPPGMPGAPVQQAMPSAPPPGFQAGPPPMMPPPGAPPMQAGPPMGAPQPPFGMPPMTAPGMPPMAAPPPQVASPAQAAEAPQQAAATGGKKKKGAGSAAAPPPPPPAGPPQQQAPAGFAPQQGFPPAMAAPQGFAPPAGQPVQQFQQPQQGWTPPGAPAQQTAAAVDFTPVLGLVDQVGKAVNALGASEAEAGKQILAALGELKNLVLVQMVALHHLYLTSEKLAPSLQGKDVGDAQKFIAYLSQYVPR